MRLTRWQIEILGFEVARELVRSKLVTGDVDKLDVEVSDILKTHAAVMKQQGVDYATMFEKVKKQLVRERKLVL